MLILKHISPSRKSVLIDNSKSIHMSIDKILLLSGYNVVIIIHAT